MFLGANNAFFSELGKGTDILTGESGYTIAQIARRYKEKGIGSIVVGDENYGEGKQPRTCRHVSPVLERPRGLDP